jgi:hypothetical protein
MSDNQLSFQEQKSAILHKMAQISCMIRGKLTSQTYTVKGRTQGPYFTLQRWEEGKNKSQRIPSDQAPAIQEAVSGFEQFQQLANQFIELSEKHTWENQTSDIKKKFRAFWRPPSAKSAPSSKKHFKK